MTPKKERPILMSAPMVRATLDGRKTMTRRVVKADIGSVFMGESPCPYGQPGDKLWVRETWQDFCPMWDGVWCGHGTQEGIERDHKIAYKATNTGINHKDQINILPIKWRPSIFMPRWASRITLEITNVMVERVQEITEKDAEAEGVMPYMAWDTATRTNQPHYRIVFKDLWDSINGKKYPWSSDPYVWVIEFRRINP